MDDLEQRIVDYSSKMFDALFGKIDLSQQPTQPILPLGDGTSDTEYE